MARGSKIWITICIVVAIGSFFLGQHFERKEQAWQSAVSALHDDIKHKLEIGEEVSRRVVMAMQAHMSLEDFKEEFGPAIPLDRAQFPDANENASHVYTNQQSYRTFFLRFKDGKLYGVSSSHGPDDIRPHLPSVDERLAEE